MARVRAHPVAMKVLGIETSCDETGVAVYDTALGGAAGLRAHAVYSQIALHAQYGGVVPELASRDHVRKLLPLIRQTLGEAGLSTRDLDGVAYTAGPGLVGALLVGAGVARALAWALDLPAIGVHHMEGHLLAPLMEDDPPAAPFVALLVSGGHTQLVAVDRIGAYRLLGETLDDAAGEAFDKIAKALGLGYPGGPALEKLAVGGDPTRYELPRALLGRKDCDFSFSGLKTAAFRIAQTCETEQDKADLAAAVQAAIARQLSDRSERAMKDYAETSDHRLFVVAGGVAANKTIRATLQAAAAKHGFDFLAPPMAYCTDNAAMIALAGAERLALGLTSDIDVVARPRWPLDEARALADPSHKPGRKGAKA